MVANIIGAGLGLVGSLFGRKQQQSMDSVNYAKQLTNNKKLAKYQNKLDFNSALKLMKKENAYNTQFMSNSSKATEALNKNLMDYQYNLERQSRQSSFQDTRKDLESAGYNPLLAVGQQSGYTNVGSGVSTQSEGLENSQLASSAVSMAQQFNDMRNANATVKQSAQRLANDILSSKYTNDLTSAQAEKARSETRGQDINNTIENIYGMTRAKLQLENLGMSTKQIKQSIINSMKQLENDTKVANSTSALNYANAKANIHNAFKTKGTSRSTTRNYPGLNMHIGPLGFGYTGKGYTDSYSH